MLAAGYDTQMLMGTGRHPEQTSTQALHEHCSKTLHMYITREGTFAVTLEQDSTPRRLHGIRMLPTVHRRHDRVPLAGAVMVLSGANGGTATPGIELLPAPCQNMCPTILGYVRQ